MSNFFKNPFNKRKKTDFWNLLDAAYQKNRELQEALTKEQGKSEGLQLHFSTRESEREELLKQKDSDLAQAKELIGSLKEKLQTQTDIKIQRALEQELCCLKRLIVDKSKNISWLSEALRDAMKQLAELNKADLAKPYLFEKTLKVKLEEELAKKEKEQNRDSQRLIEQLDVEVKRFQDVVSMKEQDIKSLRMKLKAAAEEALEQDKIQMELQKKLKEERNKTAGLYKLLEQKVLRLNNNTELLEKKNSENEELIEALQTEREKREEERKEKEERERKQAEERERAKEEEEREEERNEKEERERKQAEEREREKKDKEEERKEKERERKQAEERGREKKEEEREEERNEKEREDDRRKWEEMLKVREEKINAREEAKRARQEIEQRNEEEWTEKKEEIEQRLNRLQMDNLWDDGEYY